MDTGLVSLKAASKNVAHKTGKFLGEKIALQWLSCAIEKLWKKIL